MRPCSPLSSCHHSCPQDQRAHTLVPELQALQDPSVAPQLHRLLGLSVRTSSQADRDELAAAVLAAAPAVKLQLLQHLAAWGCVFDWRSPLAALPRSVQEYFTRRPGDVRVLCQHPGMQLLLQLSCDVPEGAARVWLDWVGGGQGCCGDAGYVLQAARCWVGGGHCAGWPL